MKNYPVLFIIILIVSYLNFMNCSKDKNPDIIVLNLDSVTFEHSMKGWELYSYPNGNEWNYTFLAGTNRLKNYNEIITNKITVTGKDTLKLLLDKFPADEEIFWMSEKWLKSIWHENYGNLSLPDYKTVKEIKDYCTQKRLKLTISE